MMVVFWNSYEVYPDGRVYSLYFKRFIKFYDNGRGYRITRLKNKRGELKTFSLHRIVAYCFVENVASLKEVNHKDGNKDNNHYSNLEWCTRSDNIQHAYDKKLRKPTNGEANPNRKLTNKDVVNVRIEIKRGRSDCAIARDYGVSSTCIRDIRVGKSWTTSCSETTRDECSGVGDQVSGSSKQ